MQRTDYRPDLDGLRAVAVLGVLLFHAFPGILPGGFSGVDIFFVLSGYLISGILYRELEAGRFRLGDFYLRRVRRIFPALLVMLSGVLVWGRWGLFQDEFEQLGKHVAASVGFLQNHVFRAESGYFDREAFSKPLLHLWSLAVEEQFYLGCPLFLAWAWGRRGRMAALLWVGVGVSLALSLAAGLGWIRAEFFLLPQRAWELGAGAALSWWEWSRRGLGGTGWRQAAAVAGLGLLVTGYFFLREDAVYPGVWALVPVVGTVLVICGGSQGGLNRWLFGNRPVVWVGRISYPLYLFHWPLLVMVHLVGGGAPRASHIWAALGVAFALAVATFWWVERRFRRTESWLVAGALVAVFLGIGMAGLAVWRGAGIRTAFAAGSEARAELARQVDLAVKDDDLMAGLEGSGDKSLSHVTRVPAPGRQTLFFGDSHMEHWSARILRVLGDAPRSGRGAIFVTEGACPPIPGVVHATKAEPAALARECERILEGDGRIDRIVIGARWRLYFAEDSKYSIGGVGLATPEGRDKALGALSEFVGRLSRKYEVTLVLDTPFGSALDPRALMWRRGYGGIRPGGEKKMGVREYLEHEGWLRERLTRIAAERGAKVIDPLPHLTDGDYCKAWDGNGPIRFDRSHLRPSYVREHASWMDQTVVE